MAATSYLKYVIKLMSVLSNLWLYMYMYECLGSPITYIFPYFVSIFDILHWTTQQEKDKQTRKQNKKQRTDIRGETKTPNTTTNKKHAAPPLHGRCGAACKTPRTDSKVLPHFAWALLRLPCKFLSQRSAHLWAMACSGFREVLPGVQQCEASVFVVFLLFLFVLFVFLFSYCFVFSVCCFFCQMPCSTRPREAPGPGQRSMARWQHERRRWRTWQSLSVTARKGYAGGYLLSNNGFMVASSLSRSNHSFWSVAGPPMRTCG